MAKAKSNAGRAGESGSAFIYIMVAVVLFGALMFAFARSARQGGAGMTGQQLQLTAADITGYAQGIERAVGRVRLRGISENQISFANGHVAGYANPGDCGTDSCRVFTAGGGAAEWEDPNPQAGDAPVNWVITGADAVPGVGDDTAADLVLLLPGIRRDLCLKINGNLNVPNPGGGPPADVDGIDQTPFTGAFASPAAGRIGDAAQLNGVRAGCFHDDASNSDVFYDVLIER
jgi:hypothetical protein